MRSDITRQQRNAIRSRADLRHARRIAAGAEELESIIELEESGAWQGDGAGNLVSWLSARWQISAASARALVREAQALRERPVLAAAMRTGSISDDQRRAITTLSREGTDDAEGWLEVLPLWDIADLQREARKHTARELERTDDGIYFRMTHTPDERFMRGEFQLHPEDGAAVLAAVDDRVPDGTKLRDWDRASARALVELAKGSAGGSKAMVLVSVDHSALAGRDGDGDVARLGSDGFVGAETARRLSCDAQVQPMYLDPSGKITGYGRVTRVVRPDIRRSVAERDHGRCTFAGCDNEVFLECHHIEHWGHGGETEVPNLLLVCWTHHELLHEGKWSLRGEAGPDITWIRPDGTPFEPRIRVTLDTS